MGDVGCSKCKSKTSKDSKSAKSQSKKGDSETTSYKAPRAVGKGRYGKEKSYDVNDQTAVEDEDETELERETRLAMEIYNEEKESQEEAGNF